jgi:tRNA A-37 threonylcarbamoyl transferase component Bud32
MTTPVPPAEGGEGALRDDLAGALSTTITLERELPRGGMARVFSAFDRTLRRRIAIKVLAPELAATISVERFRREIMVAASLQHPNIVPVLSAGEAGGLPYFIMPFVEGESLRQRLARGPLSVRESIGITRDVTRALMLAHDRGIVHRDIKPDNVLLSGGTAAVTDFGVAKALDAARDRVSGGASVTITREGVAVGTPAYMAPEQAAGDPSMDYRVDLYAIGILAYEMLMGSPPFRGRTLRQLMAAQMSEPPTPIATRRSGVPSELIALIEQCLQKDPAKRPKSAAAILRVLESPELLSGAFEASGDRKPLLRRRWDWGAIATWGVLVLLSVAGVAYGLWPEGKPGAAPAPAVSASAAPESGTTLLVPTLQAAEPGAAALAGARAITERLVAGLAGTAGVRVAGPPLADSLARLAPDTASHRITLLGLFETGRGRGRLTVRLVDAKGFTVWGRGYSTQSADAFQMNQVMVDSATAGIAGQLRTRSGLP